MNTKARRRTAFLAIVCITSFVTAVIVTARQQATIETDDPFWLQNAVPTQHGTEQP